MAKRDDGTYTLEYDRPKSIGYVAPFYGNFAVILRAYAYILMLGREGLVRVAENAVLNANYIRHRLASHYDQAFDRHLHARVRVQPAPSRADNGVHASTSPRPSSTAASTRRPSTSRSIVKEALMIEPTETESQETLDAFVDALIEIAGEAKTNPAKLKEAPVTTCVSRPDETAAARNLDIACLP